MIASFEYTCFATESLNFRSRVEVLHGTTVLPAMYTYTAFELRYKEIPMHRVQRRQVGARDDASAVGRYFGETKRDTGNIPVGTRRTTGHKIIGIAVDHAYTRGARLRSRARAREREGRRSTQTKRGKKITHVEHTQKRIFHVGTFLLS